MNDTWQRLSDEAALAAEQMAIGASALGRANYAEGAFYLQAFFALSIGFERSAKLAIVVDHALLHGGRFPTAGAIQNYGHNLRKLLDEADAIAKRRGFSTETNELPRSKIHDGIVTVLSDFASNVTRYYNLDVVTGNPRTAKIRDPVHSWFELVIAPVLDRHYKPRQRLRHEQNARAVAGIMGPYSSVIHHAETGEVLDSVYEASLRTGMTKFVIPWARMYVMQISRFLGCLLSDLGREGHTLPSQTIPYLSDFYRIFNNDDKYFRQRKTWSIY